MPSAPQNLKALWRDDADAFAYLRMRGYEIDRGVIQVDPRSWRKLTRMDHWAIDYLVSEWDYGCGWIGG